mgnify:CR=1 FL=1
MIFLDIETTTFFQDANIKALPRDQQIAAMEFGIAVTIDSSETSPRGWSFAIHRTDRPASELLISLHSRMGEARDVISRKRASVKLGETEAA